jgi:uncharacterized protein RhaS with RHS repeats
MNTADPQQMNGYSYTENNPVTFNDPTGRTKCDVNPELCGKKDNTNTCKAACIKKNKEKGDKANRETQEYFAKKRKKELQEVYDYFFKADQCRYNLDSSVGFGR